MFDSEMADIGYYSGIGGLVGTIFERSAVDYFWIVDSLGDNFFFAKVDDAGIV
jgi:hypothetical protein